MSHSIRGVLRGMHRSPYTKLVTVTRGAVYDVIVDLRTSSPTYRRWLAIDLNSRNKRQLHIPAGCGHGFLCLEDADVLYLQGGNFQPSSEIDVNPFDPSLGIHWPKLEDVPKYIISAKDTVAQNLLDCSLFRSSIIESACPPRRVLVIGASGQVGGALVEALGTINVIGTYSGTACDGMVHFDLEVAATNQEYVEEFISMCRPEIVFVCAGCTWVDGCENEEIRSYRVNRDGPGMVARYSKLYGARTVYYSTDYVFDGQTADVLYSESDMVGPLNVYGSSKLAGEKAVMEEDPAALVIRTTGVYGPEIQGKNFVYQLCRSLSQGLPVRCATDSFGCPTYNRDLAKMSISLTEVGASGIFHCVGPTTLSRFAFASRVAKAWNLDTTRLQETDSRTIYLDTADRLGFAAMRGAHFGMSIAKLKETVPVECQPREIDEALAHWKLNPRGASCI